jgi:hypothetical protein
MAKPDFPAQAIEQQVGDQLSLGLYVLGPRQNSWVSRVLVACSARRSGFRQVGFGGFRAIHQLAMRNLLGDEALQLVVVGEIDEAEPSLTEDFLNAVATNVRGSRRSRDGRAGFPSRFVYGLVSIVYAGCPSFGWV